MSPFATLPDLCLLALFKQLPPVDQMTARKVCHRWGVLAFEATRKRHSLNLLLGHGSIEMFETGIDLVLYFNHQSLKFLNAEGPTERLTWWNSLHFDSLDQTTAEDIATTYIGINNLKVTACYVSSSTVDSLAHLLEHWSHQLTTFRLIYNCLITIDEPVISRLSSAINGLSTLRQLHLEMFDLPVRDLPIISQLEKLRFFSNRTTPEKFSQWLQQYGEGNRGLVQIEYSTFLENDLVPFLKLSEPLRRHFTHLCFNPTRNPVPHCVHFSGLTTLRLSPRHITPRQLFSPLATLHQLIHLSLFIDFDSFLADDLDHHHLLLPQVKSVKALDLGLWDLMPVHQQLAKLKLPWTLPNVQFIYFDFANLLCTQCNISGFHHQSAQAQLQCLHQLFDPFKRHCTKLRLIRHSAERAQGTAEEILAKCASNAQI